MEKERKMNKRAKMALDHSPEFRHGHSQFFVAFGEEFKGISLCSHSASNPH